RARAEGAHHEAAGDERGVRRGRHVEAVAAQRTNVTPVEPHRRERSVPADGVERIEREAHGAERLAALDDHAPRRVALLRAKRLVDARRVEHARIEYRLLADDAALG